MVDNAATFDTESHKSNLNEIFFEPIEPDNDQNMKSKLYNTGVIRKSISENKLESLVNSAKKLPVTKTNTLDPNASKSTSKLNLADEKSRPERVDKKDDKSAVQAESIISSSKAKQKNKKDKNVDLQRELINKYLPQSRFGLGPDHADTILLVIRFFRIVLMVYVVWLIGYLGFSASWILIAVFIYMYREKLIKDRLLKSKMIKALGINEKKTILARIDEVPSWVYFPDKDRAEWLNKIIKQVWPYLIPYLTKMVFEQIEPMINQYSPAFIDQIKIKEIDLGDTPPRIGSVKVYSDHVPNDEIIIDVEVLYAGDAQVKIKAKKILAGIKDIQFQGDARIVLKPLCTRMPFFAAMKFFLLKLPDFDFNLTDAANTLDMPGLRKLIDVTITDVISKTLVLPNRLVIPIIPDYDLSDIESFQTFHPRGVLRIHIQSASNLKNADIGLGIFNKSDPYVKITGIGIPIQTKVIRNNLNPVWNETYHIMIDEIDLEPKLLVEVYDKDEINDDFLGGLTFRVDDFVYKRVEENNYKLKNVKQGHLRMKFEWFYLSTRREKLSEIRRMQQQNSNATCVLLVTLKSASDLPNLKKYVGGISEPNPRVLLEINNKRVVSSVKPRTTNPKWNENHYFFLENPEIDKLVCSIEDEPTKTVIANMSFSLGELLKEEELQIDRYFDLNSKQMGYNPKLSMRLALKIFTPNKDETCNGRITPTLLKETDSEADHSDNDLIGEPIVTNLTPKAEASNLRKTSDVSKEISGSSLSIGKMQEKVDYGKIRLSTKYLLSDNVFVLTVHECRNLQTVNGTVLPNPYLKVMILPDRKTKKKIKGLKETNNPVFNERIQWNINYADLKKRKLLITVKNDKLLHLCDSSFLGQIIVDLSKVDVNSSLSSWFDLRSREDSKIMIDRIE